MMHTAEKWLQEGRQVRDKEQPCAFKNARSSNSKSKSKSVADELSDLPQGSHNEINNSQNSSALFGEWQTEPYVPPTMENGIIPTNSFGNVYMYRPDMVPFGCAHLPFKGIKKVAKQLGITWAPALVGWEYRKGKSYPEINGIVVVAEHAELLHTVYFDEMSMKEQSKADKEAQAKAQEAKADAKKRKIAAYVDGTYNLPTSDARPGYLLADESILPPTALHPPAAGEDNQPPKKYKSDADKPSTTKQLDASTKTKPTTKQTSTTKMPTGKGQNPIGPDSHFHVFPESGYTYDEECDTWYKACPCGATVPFEKM